MRRETFFIKANGIYWLPRPTSWLGGWARSRWFNRAMKTQSKIVSPEFWDILQDSHDIMKLVEKDGIILTLYEEAAEFDGAGVYLISPTLKDAGGQS